MPSRLTTTTVRECRAPAGFALAEGLGLDPNLLLDAIEGGTLDLPYLRMEPAERHEIDWRPRTHA